MSDLISKSEEREWVENWFVMNSRYHPYAKKNTIPIGELYDILERMPTIDAVDASDHLEALAAAEQRGYNEGLKHGAKNAWMAASMQGTWIKDGEAYALYKCSACNYLCTVAGYADCISEEQMYKTFKFCPNCGAIMKENGDD